MKNSDYSVENLRRSLRDEAKAMRERARKLDDIAAFVKRDVADGTATMHTFTYAASEATSVITHRSSVHPQFIARYASEAAAEAAIEWEKRQETS